MNESFSSAGDTLKTRKSCLQYELCLKNKTKQKKNTKQNHLKDWVLLIQSTVNVALKSKLLSKLHKPGDYANSFDL